MADAAVSLAPHLIARDPAPRPARAPARPTSAGVSAPPSRIAAGATLPLTFIATGAAAAALATGWLAWSPGLLALPHVHPEVVAFAHLWLLGALLTICCGAIYQLMPVLANVPFAGTRLAWTHLGLHVAGVALMVPAFRVMRMERVAFGGTLVAAGVGLLAVNVVRILRAAARRDVVLTAFALAVGWLGVTVLVGVLLAANLRFGWFGVDVLAVLRAHAHLGVIGFFLTLLQGAMFRLVPMFTLGAWDRPKLLGVALVVSQFGLVVLATSLGLGRVGGEAFGAVLLASSYGLTAVELRRVWRSRRKRIVEPALRGFLAGLGLIGGATILGVILVAFAAGARAALAYGVIAILGGVLLAVEGMLGKIVPFLVWMRIYGPRVGQGPVPKATELGLAPAERAWLVLHVAGALSLAVGAALGAMLALTIGAWSFALGQVALGASLGCAAWHLGWPAAAADRTL